MRRPAAEVTDADLHALAADLRIVLVGMRKRLRQEATLGDFSFNQLQVVLRLERDGPATVSALAKAEGMRPQSMSEMVAVLKAGGLLAGAPDPVGGTFSYWAAACSPCPPHRPVTTLKLPQDMGLRQSAIRSLDPSR